MSLVIKKAIFFMMILSIPILFLVEPVEGNETVTITAINVDEISTEEITSNHTGDTTQTSFPEPWNTLNQTGDLAQWVIALVLGITAIVILVQIKNQTRAKKVENYLKVVELLGSKEFSESYEEIKILFKTSPSLLNRSDSQLPINLKPHVSKIKETYQAIGSMIYSGMVDEYLFLFAFSLNGRDAWHMLKENVNKTNDEINKEQLNEEMYHSFFKYVGIMCIFWRSFSSRSRLFLLNNGILSVKPNSLLFDIITTFRKLLKKDIPWN